MELKIDGEAAREFVQEALMRSLTPDTKEAVIKQAVQSLVARPPKDSRYGAPEPESPLEMAFRSAVRAISHQVVTEYLNDDEVKEAIRTQILAALDAIVQEKGTWLYDQIGFAVGEKIASVLGGERL